MNEVVGNALYKQSPSTLDHKGFERAQAFAPPLFWGSWVQIFSQFGVVGRDSDQHVTTVRIDFDTISRTPSTFDVEIKGADRFVSTTGPGSQTVTITGNVATAISVRCKSHSLGQAINISASW